MSNSKRWLQEHFSDKYVKQAQLHGYPSRAAYKLLELQDKDKLIKKGMAVVDLGAAPGGWSMVANEIVGDKGQVIALDILPMDPVTGVIFIQGDFTEQSVLDELIQVLDQRLVDIVMSDMAPNLSGQKSIDQPRAMYLVELAWSCAQDILRPGGTFIAKIFQGSGVEALVAEMKPYFKQIKYRKPDSSRPRSREVFLVAQGFQQT